jgi:hypothetical protein
MKMLKRVRSSRAKGCATRHPEHLNRKNKIKKQLKAKTCASRPSKRAKDEPLENSNA